MLACDKEKCEDGGKSNEEGHDTQHCLKRDVLCMLVEIHRNFYAFVGEFEVVRPVCLLDKTMLLEKRYCLFHVEALGTILSSRGLSGMQRACADSNRGSEVPNLV